MVLVVAVIALLIFITSMRWMSTSRSKGRSSMSTKVPIDTPRKAPPSRSARVTVSSRVSPSIS
ncbi:MAG: hypothetical protein P8N02_18960, partial [Actinomycetota bacterium]|nr:hypothetical protein [Actinomycetota bacterium]